MNGDEGIVLSRRTFGQLSVEIYPDKRACGKAAARNAAVFIQDALKNKPEANIVLATGNSMLDFLAELSHEDIFDWQRVNIFHMDEYLGMPASHPASFRRFLREKIVDYVKPAAFYGIGGEDEEPELECRRYDHLLRQFPADLCCLGIGENGHLAFNDPPVANFRDPEWVKVVKLDYLSRQQQAGEGHFPSLDLVPTHAITLTIPALLSARKIIGIVPERRKAKAVRNALQGPVSTQCPASILQKTAHARLFLDSESASLLEKQ